jgi:4-phospho-D-threonate 3-dehydrogenase / 4-phospho-D-erythronate 3-dehydrogenase
MINTDRPLIAITMGDASGIGPEIIAKALHSEDIYRLCKPIVIGDIRVMHTAFLLTKSPYKMHLICNVNEAEATPGTVDILDMNNLSEDEVNTGKLCKACGKAAVDYISKATELAINNEVRAIVTAPINKEATHLAGCGDLGHMELFTRITRTTETATMLMSGNLRVVHLTTHHSLSKALGFVTRERILARLRLTWSSFLKWGFVHPRLAVAAINPHGGEGGILGEEEIQEIRPAVRAAQEMGINVSGPYPADSVFTRAISGEFDAVLAMYHDQGHIPIKVYGFEKSVSVALGLPFIRTSVDHGTAFDIAGKGIANAQSMTEAIRVAVKLAEGKGLK